MIPVAIQTSFFQMRTPLFYRKLFSRYFFFKNLYFTKQFYFHCLKRHVFKLLNRKRESLLFAQIGKYIIRYNKSYYHVLINTAILQFTALHTYIYICVKKK